MDVTSVSATPPALKGLRPATLRHSRTHMDGRPLYPEQRRVGKGGPRPRSPAPPLRFPATRRSLFLATPPAGSSGPLCAPKGPAPPATAHSPAPPLRPQGPRWPRQSGPLGSVPDPSLDSGNADPTPRGVRAVQDRGDMYLWQRCRPPTAKKSQRLTSPASRDTYVLSPTEPPSLGRKAQSSGLVKLDLHNDSTDALYPPPTPSPTTSLI